VPHLGLLIVVVVLAASVQDRDGAKTALLSAYLISPIQFVFADGGFASRIARGEPATRQQRRHWPDKS